ncbi:GNAT family N-acetyltransferase [Caballeronia grimmiae]|uniref:GNAT family N-acetyltransferase n=1 Tax=Caballeronia grimmiae TaxID=1071679 RepID=UPI0038BC317E
MPIVVRPATADELAHAEEMVARSINDLTVRHGFGPIATSRPSDFQAFCHRDDPRGVWLAEDDGGEIVGFAMSWVCDRLWFLAELFVAPGRQGEGIGNELLARTVQHASEAGATEKSLITFAFNLVSQGLYVRQGLLPRVPIYLCRAERESLGPAHGPTLSATPFRMASVDFEILRQLDLATLGVSREKHHRYLLGDPTMKGVFLEEGGQRVGYAYIAATGHVGPLAVTHAHGMPGAIRAALAVAVSGDAKQISVFVPGTSEALATAASQGMRFALPMVLMSTRECGNWTRYLPRNPGFM